MLSLSFVYAARERARQCDPDLRDLIHIVRGVLYAHQRKAAILCQARQHNTNVRMIREDEEVYNMSSTATSIFRECKRLESQ